jgi:hypothetical protein
LAPITDGTRTGEDWIRTRSCVSPDDRALLAHKVLISPVCGNQGVQTGESGRRTVQDRQCEPKCQFFFFLSVYASPLWVKAPFGAIPPSPPTLSLSVCLLLAIRLYVRFYRLRKKSLAYSLRSSKCCFFEPSRVFSRCFGLPSAVFALSADTTAPALHRRNQFH